MLSAGEALSRYRIIERIGAGGMGEVYRAHDERLHRDVALKVLPPQSLRSESARKAFRQEALALSRLNHANIQTVFDFDRQGEHDFLVTEYVEGESLRDRLREGALPAAEIVSLGTQMADGLAAAHGRGIVHRDLKPENVRLTREGQVKLLDFGLAHFLPTADASTVQSMPDSLSGAGTLHYMAPEQLQGKTIDARTDVYALGVVLYEMAAGRLPHTGKTTAEVVTSILFEAPSPARTANPGLPSELAAVIDRAMRKLPEERYGSAAELRNELIHSGAGGVTAEAPGQRPGRQKGRPRWGWRRMALMLGVVLGLAAVGIGVRTWQERRRMPGASGDRLSVAVLPFRATSGNAEDRELGIGLADAIISGLGASPQLLVRPMRATLPYAGSDTDPLQVGRALKAATILDGTVQRSGGRLRISAQFLRVSDGSTLWSQQFDTKAGDAFGVQDEIGAGIARALRIQTGTAVRQQLSTVANRDPEVYHELLQARVLMLSAKQEALQQATPLLEDAVRREPGNALAHSWLASVYRARAFLYEPGNPDLPKLAEQHARQAMSLDPALAEPYGVLASILWSPARGFQHDEAARLEREALERNPNLSAERAALGLIYFHVGLLDRAVIEEQQALEIEPENLRTLAELSDASRELGKYKDAEQYARAALETDPDYLYATDALAHVLITTGRYSEAEAILAKPIYAAVPFRRYYLSALIAARRGDLPQALRLARKAEETGKGYGHFHHVAFAIAQVYADMGDKAKAVHYIRQAAETGMPGYPLYRDCPDFKSLRGYPDFDAEMKQLEDAWRERQRSMP